MKSLVIGLSSLLAIVVLILGFIGFHFVNSSPGTNSEQVVFDVEPGKPFTKIAQELYEKRLINNSKLFRVYAQLLGQTDKIKIGEYGLRENMTPSEVLEVLVSGKSILRKFTVSEGLNLFEIADLYEKQGFGSRDKFLELALNEELAKKLTGEEVKTLEGFLFPETYELTKFTRTEELISLMIKNFKDNFSKVNLQGLGEGWNPLKVLTLASIIEKETGSPEERPQISAVFHNRLKKGMMLQTDPTIIYGLAIEKRQTIYNITREDIHRPTPYNTYTIRGLPPGPISNPGLASLQAAVTPADVQSLYFVSKNDGTHVFTENYADHEAAVRKFQMDRSAREGKSWRDLNKKEESATSSSGAEAAAKTESDAVHK